MIGRCRSCHCPRPLQLAGVGDDGIWGMQEVSTSWERCPHNSRVSAEQNLRNDISPFAKPQQLTRAGAQLSPCHGNVTSGIYPDVTEKDGFIIFSFKCIPLLL